MCVDRERTRSRTRPSIKKCLLIYITLVSISSSFRDFGNSFGDPDGTSLKETGGVGDLIGSSRHRGFLGDTHRSPIRKALRDVPWIFFGKTLLLLIVVSKCTRGSGQESHYNKCMGKSGMESHQWVGVPLSKSTCQTQ